MRTQPTGGSGVLGVAVMKGASIVTVCWWSGRRGRGGNFQRNRWLRHGVGGGCDDDGARLRGMCDTAFRAWR